VSESKEYFLIVVASLMVGCTLAFIVYAWRNRKEFGSLRVSASNPSTNDVYLGLRNQILQGSQGNGSVSG
jgi:hypothetical protein